MPVNPKKARAKKKKAAAAAQVLLKYTKNCYAWRSTCPEPWNGPVSILSISEAGIYDYPCP